MKIFKCLNGLFFLTLLASCSSDPAKKSCHASYEINVKNPADTLNKIDCDGLKQGKWIPSPSNKLKDTVYYHNDTLVNN